MIIIEDSNERIQEEEQKAQENKTNFLQSFENTYGKSFYSCAPSIQWMSVTKETINPSNGAGNISKGATYIGGAIWIIGLFTGPSSILSFLGGSATVTGLCAQAEYDFGSSPHDQYVKYLVDIGGTYDWQRNPDTGEWSGKACGEILIFYDIGGKGRLEFQGRVDFASHACTFPTTSPRYTYYTTAAAKGIYMYDLYISPIVIPVS